MKNNSFFNALTMMTMVVSAILFFSSCQQEEPVLDASAPISNRTPAPEVPANLEVPAGYRVSHHVYAEGSQIYVCQETAPGVYEWVFQAPEAKLYANPSFVGLLGTHYGGPTWESNSGSKVKAVKIAGATVDSTAIPWLLLVASSTEGSGMFDRTVYIQRVNTVGGLPPDDGAMASTVGLELHRDYTAEYYFYTEQ